MVDVNGSSLRRLVTVGFIAHACVIAMMTGVGLFFANGIDHTGSWKGFILATVVALGGVVWGVRSALGTGAFRTDEGKPVGSPVKAATDGPFAEIAGAMEPPLDSEDIDYLTALRHELRTPLNAVLGFSDVLLSGIDGEMNDSQREDLEIIRASGIRLRILLDSALDLSQLSIGGLRLDAEQADVRELVSRAGLEATQLWSNKRGAHSTLPDEPCVMVVDEGRLRRSILVLADCLATNHRDADIALSLAVSSGQLTIEITASQSSHPPFDALPTLGEVLASEDPAEIRRWPVAVASEVIRCHHGSLYVGDAPSRFSIRLPLRGLQ